MSEESFSILERGKSSFLAEQSNPAVRSTKSPIQWDPGTLSSGVQLPELRMSEGVPLLPNFSL
jgi:hypothetical protein